jgi:hypothetical protein
MNKTKVTATELATEHHSYRIEKPISPKSLAVTLSVFIIFFATLAWSKRPQLTVALSILFVINVFFYLCLPKVYTLVVKGWSKLGAIMHSLVQPLFVGSLFILVFLPVGLLMRLFGKNTLWRNGTKLNSMWQKPSPSKNFKDQF